MKSCKEVAQLIASGENLGFFEKVSVKMHFIICKGCRRYHEQQELIVKEIKERHDRKISKIQKTSSEVEAKVLENLKKD
ncbi:MAG: hypothetical protein GY909_18640 [Oligoflexia bacterium]|nr:hypothetical protein [Oligoflexia bacterium]